MANAGAALIVYASVSMILVIINFSFTGAGVQETFPQLLSLAVVLQLNALSLHVWRPVKDGVSRSLSCGDATAGRRCCLLEPADYSPLFLGIALAFFPAQQITSLRSYELWMFGGTPSFIGIAAFSFSLYGRRKTAQQQAAMAPGI